MSLKPQVEALIYAAEEPITLDQLSLLLKDAVLAELAAARENAAMARADEVRADDAARGTPAESMLLPELDAAWEEELSGLNPGPWLVQNSPEAAQAGSSPERESLWEDDEPFFAIEAGTMESAALSEFSPEDRSGEADAAPESSAAVAAPETAARKRQPKKSEQE